MAASSFNFIKDLGRCGTIYVVKIQNKIRTCIVKGLNAIFMPQLSCGDVIITVIQLRPIRKQTYGYTRLNLHVLQFQERSISRGNQKTSSICRRKKAKITLGL